MGWFPPTRIKTCSLVRRRHDTHHNMLRVANKPFKLNVMAPIMLSVLAPYCARCQILLVVLPHVVMPHVVKLSVTAPFAQFSTLKPGRGALRYMDMRLRKVKVCLLSDLYYKHIAIIDNASKSQLLSS